MFRWGRAALIPLAITGALLVACSDDEADADATEEPTAAAEATGTGTAEATATATEAAATATATEAAAETVEVTAVDYGYEGLPESVKAGTRLSLVNASEVEFHELVTFRIPDDEERSVEELLALPEEEQMALFQGPPAAVILAGPASSESIYAVGDGVLTEAGRYLVACFIPVGADPEAFAEAAASGANEPPEVEGGPPHFTEGMWAELTVTE